jgi:RNA polymerase sigma-70 factor (ECF subfamily)
MNPTGANHTTCWELISGAANGNAADQDEFVRLYQGPIGAYLSARWQGKSLAASVDDTAQEVFIECFRKDGVLERADPARDGGFRPFLYGVVRNVALRLEAAKAKEAEGLQAAAAEEVAADETSLSQAFDRAWAKSTMQQAARRQLEVAQAVGEEAVRRVELLKLRFQEGLPIRDIASLWQVPAETLHREYAKARQEFKLALREVVAGMRPGSDAEIDGECSQLLELLS